MAISKVVYGTKVLVDLTSDTVDAAHLAKGYTAHDAAGNLIVGVMEQQAEPNILAGVSPTLDNGASYDGSAWFTPARTSTENTPTYYLYWPIPQSSLTASNTYFLSMSTIGYGGSGRITANLNYKDAAGNANVASAAIPYGTSWASESATFAVPSGMTPVSMSICKWGKHPAVSLTNVRLWQ